MELACSMMDFVANHMLSSSSSDDEQPPMPPRKLPKTRVYFEMVAKMDSVEFQTHFRIRRCTVCSVA